MLLLYSHSLPWESLSCWWPTCLKTRTKPSTTPNAGKPPFTDPQAAEAPGGAVSCALAAEECKTRSCLQLPVLQGGWEAFSSLNTQIVFLSCEGAAASPLLLRNFPQYNKPLSMLGTTDLWESLSISECLLTANRILLTVQLPT